MSKTIKLHKEPVALLVCLITLALVYRDSTKLTWLTPMLCVFLAYQLSVKFVPTKSKHVITKFRFPEVFYLPFKVPFLDGLITVMRLRLEGLDLLSSLSKKYGLSFEVSLGLTRVVVVTEPDKLQVILGTSTENVLNKPDYLYRMVLPDFIRNGLIAAPYQTWVKHRRAVSPAFTYKGMMTCLEFINNGARQLIQETDHLLDQAGCLHNTVMQKHIDKVAVRIITEFIFGSPNSNTTDCEREEFIENLQEAKDLCADRLQNAFQILPFVWMMHPNKRRAERAMQNVKKYVDKLIDTYKTETVLEIFNDTCQFPGDKTEEFGVKPFKCLLHLLTNSSLSTQEIIEEVTTFVAAGHDTISTAIMFVVFHLASHPEVQNQCRREVRGLLENKQALGKDVSSFTTEDCAQLKYLERCILEGMRLTPPIPFILRNIQEPLEILPGKMLNGNQIVLINISGIHRDENIYPDPLKFIPDRFHSEEVKKRPPNSFLPFSTGVRNCIGWKIALMEMKVILSTLLNNYEFLTTEKLADLKLDFSITLQPDRIPDVTFKKLLSSQCDLNRIT